MMIIQKLMLLMTFGLLLMASSCKAWSSISTSRTCRDGEYITPITSGVNSKEREALGRKNNAESMRGEHQIWIQSFQKTMLKPVITSGLTLLTSFSLCFLNPQEATASTSDMAVGQKYWSIMSSSSKEDRIQANEALLDYVVGSINIQYYDNTGGNRFTPADFYRQWRSFRRVALSGSESADTYRPKQLQVSVANPQQPIMTGATVPKGASLDNREGAVQGLRWLVSTLDDPFSKYLTRDELKEELSVSGDRSFLGTGAIVEAYVESIPQRSGGAESISPSLNRATKGLRAFNARTYQLQATKKNLPTTKVSNLPVITAIEPDSLAERVGLVVGDRIVAVGSKSFLGRTKHDVGIVFTSTTNKYNGRFMTASATPSQDLVADLTIAKPIYAFPGSSTRDIVVGYRQSRLRVPTTTVDQNPTFETPDSTIRGGDNLVHYQLLSSSTSGSIFDRMRSDAAVGNDSKVGYLRLTRFSKASTDAYVKAIDQLEEAGAQSYIFDLRNNYGGRFQDALLMASSLIRDPHAIMCYTMNARGAFVPHEVEQYAVDKRYPGYLLSKEASGVTLDQLHKEKPKMFLPDGQVDWDPPSSYASVHEQVAKRGIHRVSFYENMDSITKDQLRAQKKIVLLVNEGTASSAEVFAAALRDNYRTVALVGTKSYGKGLIQHTFPTPDGGGLRLTIAEYLTPNLQHVTNVGGARFDRETGEFLGGGLKPDILCESRHGIPANTRGDLCIGIALDALEEANSASKNEEKANDVPRGVLMVEETATKQLDTNFGSI